MTMLLPTSARTVESQMADYRARIAAKIKREMALRGENEVDVASAIGTTPRTVERWVAAETEPQRRLKKPLADHFDLEMTDLWPDLEAEEQAVLDQLDRIEEKLDRVLNEMAAMRAGRAVRGAQAGSSGGSRRKQPSKAKKRASS